MPENDRPSEQGPRSESRFVLGALARAHGLRGAIPAPLRRFARGLLPWEAYQREAWAAHDPCPDSPDVSGYEGRVPATLGIVQAHGYLWRNYICACRELGVPYRVVDITGPDWLARVRESGCDGFLVWPCPVLSSWKQLTDERVMIMVDELGAAVYPSYRELWLYESKRRVQYWLEANDVPRPRTWIFTSHLDALAFARSVELPVVFKTDLGSSAAGVRIVTGRRALLRLIDRSFTTGVARLDGHRGDRHWGSAILQEYLEGVQEWRAIRLGRSYFGHKKLKRGAFHSGSGRVSWENPPMELLDLVHGVTERGRFTSAALDVFETPDGRFVVNELQPLFGSYSPTQMIVDGRPGRYVRDETRGSWRFEEGIFCANASCNLRVLTFLELLGHSLEGPSAGDRP